MKAKKIELNTNCIKEDLMYCIKRKIKRFHKKKIEINSNLEQGLHERKLMDFIKRKTDYKKNGD